MTMTTLESNSWQTDVVKQAKDVDSSSPQLLLLTADYPSGSNQQLMKDISSEPDLTSQSHLLLDQVGSLSPFSKEFLSQDGIPVGLERDDLGSRQTLTNRIRDDDNLNMHDEINLPNALCSVGWDTDSEDESDDEVCQVINDRPVLCRAKATLPVAYLTLGNIQSTSEFGVFATQPLPKRCQFGPMDGSMMDACDPGCSALDHLNLSIQKKDLFVNLDISNEELSNWMRYVRIAERSIEQNVALVQKREGLYFMTCRPLQQGNELKVWYSQSYASIRFLPLLSALEGTKWKCSLCNFKCNQSSSIMEHMDNHKTLKKLAMQEGIKNKQNQPQINQTNQKSNNEKKSIFPRQGSTESSHSSSQDDFNSSGEHNSREWWCSHCSLCFNTATTLNFHMLAHAADDLEAGVGQNCDHCHVSHDQCGDCVGQENKPLNCNMCPRFFTNNASLACHVKSHSSDKKYECPICKQIFPKVLELKNHIHSHSKNGIFTCNQCSKEFKMYKHIRKHIRAFHSDRLFSCDVCKKDFNSAVKLRTHKLTHSGEFQYLCANCGKQFKRKDKLGEHMRRIHCADGKKNLHQRMSKQHLVKANEGLVHYVYKCQICVIGFKRRGMLVNHMANRHPDLSLDEVPALNLPILKPTKDYYCQYCDKIYKSTSKRKAHILKCHPGAKLPPTNRQLSSSKKVHEDGNPEDTVAGSDDATYTQTVGSITTEPHGCQWCHKQYASKAKLLQHQRNKHGSLLLLQEQSPSPSASTISTQARSVIVNALEPEKSGSSGRLSEQKTVMSDTLIPLTGDYELLETDGYFITEGEFIVDAPTLRRALKGEISAELGGDLTGFEALLSQSRPDQYFKVTQTAEGLTIAQPLEVWDNVYPPLSPPTTAPPR